MIESRLDVKERTENWAILRKSVIMRKHPILTEVIREKQFVEKLKNSKGDSKVNFHHSLD
jgi:hypothetical protein